MEQENAVAEPTEDQVLELLSSDSFLIINKHILRELGPEPTILLCDLLDRYKYFKQTHQLTDDGYFYVLYEDQKEALNLSEHKVRICRKILEENQLISRKKFPHNGGPPILYIRCNIQRIIQILPRSNFEQGDHCLVQNPDKDTISYNKKQSNIRKEKNIKKRKEKNLSEQFISKLPESWKKNNDLREQIENYIDQRKKLGYGFTERSQVKAVNLFKKHFGELNASNIPAAIKTFECSVDHDWRGLFPNKFTYMNEDTSEEALHSPEEIIQEHFKNKYDRSMLYRHYQSAEDLLTGYDENENSKLANHIVTLYDCIEKEQVEDDDIPTPGRLLSEYIHWLGQQRWLEVIRPEHFFYTSKVFQDFILRTKRQTGIHPIKGKQRLYSKQRETVEQD